MAVFGAAVVFLIASPGGQRASPSALAAGCFPAHPIRPQAAAADLPTPSVFANRGCLRPGRIRLVEARLSRMQEGDSAASSSVSDVAFSPGKTTGPASRGSRSLSLEAAVGWNGYFRPGPAWTPVRAVLTNRAATTVSGTLRVPLGGAGPAAPATYVQTVVVPAGERKSVTLYVPGAQIGGELDVTFQAAHVLAESRLLPIPFESRDVTIGTLTSDPATLTWIDHARVGGADLVTIPLSPQSLDAVPEVLATFDLIVISNFDSSRLTPAQIAALGRYVRNGGGLLLVGGPDWRETLQPLSPDLLPGAVTGAVTRAGLEALPPVASAAGPKGPAIVSLLRPRGGTIVSTESGVPLVARQGLGNGQIEYLAFDPSLAPFPTWRGATPLFDALIAGAAPQGMRRLALPSGYDAVSFLAPNHGLIALPDELSSLSAGIGRYLLPMVLLIVFYALVCGAAIYLVTRRWHRPNLIWAAVPSVALVFGLAVLAAAPQLRAAQVSLTIVGMIDLDGNGPYPARLYVGVRGMTAGTSQLAYANPALANTVADAGAWTIAEGSQTDMVARRVNQSTPATVRLLTSLALSGQIRASLHMNQDGWIVGSIVNGTAIPLRRPALIAGRKYELLPDLAPGSSVRVRLLPANNVHDHHYGNMLYRIYGSVYAASPANADRTPTSQPQALAQGVSALPESNIVGMMGEVTLVAWTDRPLAPIRVVGADAQRRDLYLIVQNLNVRPAPVFDLRSGVYGAWLVDETPARSEYPCCGPTAQGVYIGQGGAADFAFALPPGIAFRRLTLGVYGGGAVATYTDYTDMPPHVVSIYDWRRSRWVALGFHHGETGLSHPNRFVAPTGAVLVRIAPPHNSVDIVIADPHQDLQLWGEGQWNHQRR